MVWHGRYGIVLILAERGKEVKQAIAHVRESDKAVQSVEVHLIETAEIAQALAKKLDLPESGELLGLMHDFGKYSQAFQEYIKAAAGVNPDVDVEDTLPNGQKIDHSTAGAQWVYRRLKKFGVQNGYRRVSRADKLNFLQIWNLK